MTLLDYEAAYGRTIPRSFGGARVAPLKGKGFGGAVSTLSTATTTTTTNSNTGTIVKSRRTNVSELSQLENRPAPPPPPPALVFKYHVSIKYVFSLPNRGEAVIEFSKTHPQDPHLKLNQNRCVRLYKKAMEQCEALRRGGPFYYDRQATLYSCTKIREKKISLTVSEGISRRSNFVRAEFTLKRCADDKCSADLLRSMPAKHLQLNDCMHYFLKASAI